MCETKRKRVLILIKQEIPIETDMSTYSLISDFLKQVICHNDEDFQRRKYVNNGKTLRKTKNG
jgi:hypothetical protein